MSDITMCSIGRHCGKRGECYRYRAVPRQTNGVSWQSYGVPFSCLSDKKDFVSIDGFNVRDMSAVDAEIDAKRDAS